MPAPSLKDWEAQRENIGREAVEAPTVPDVDTIEPAPGDSPEDIAKEMVAGPGMIQRAATAAAAVQPAMVNAAAAAMPEGVRQGAAPPPRPAGPPPVRVPPQYAGQMGGYYYGPDKDAWLSGLESDRLTESNGVTDANAQKAIAQREQWEQSVPGRIADLERTKQAGMQRVGGYQRGAMELHSAGQAAQAHEMAEYREQEDRRFKSAQARRKRMMDDYQAQMERYARANDAISQAKIDPERFWNSKTTGSKISSAIFLGLGAAGAIAGGGPNYALQILDKQIGRDIDAQKHNLANKRAGLAGQQSLLGMMRQHYDTEEQAEAATRAHAYRQLQNKVETIGKTTNSLITRQKSAELGAKLQAAAELSEKNLGVMAAKLSAAAEQARINAANQAAQHRAKLEEQKRQAEALSRGGMAWSNADKGDRALYSEAAGGFAPDPEARKTLDKLYSNTAGLVSGIDELRTLGKSGSSLSPADRAVAEQKATLLIMGFKEAFAMGALDKGALEIGGRLAANPLLITTIAGQRQLNEIRKSVLLNRDAKVRSLGLQPGMLAPGMDENGNIVLRKGTMMPTDEKMQRRFEAAQRAAGQSAPSDVVNSAFVAD